MAEGRRIVAGIIGVCALVVAIEFGLVALIGLPAGPLAPAAAYAAGVPAGQDCDTDPSTDRNGDPSEVKECYRPLLSEDAADLATKILSGVGAVTAAGYMVGFAAFEVSTWAVLPPLVVVAPQVIILFAITVLAIGVLAALAADPASSNQAVALAQGLPIPTPHIRLSACRPGKRRSACRAAVAAFNALGAAAKSTAVTLEAAATSTSRFMAAKHEGLASVEMAQAAAAKVYLGEALGELRIFHASALAFARALAPADVPLTHTEVTTALKRMETLKGLPAKLVARLETRVGYTRGGLKATLRNVARKLLRRGAPRSVQRALSQPLPGLAGATTFAQSLSIEEVGYMVDNMWSSGELSRPTGAALADELLLAEGACTAGERASPMNAFIATVHAHVHGAAQGLLRDAAGPLFGNHPYPGNVPPTASFRASPSSQTIDAHGLAHVAFFNSSADSGDGGHVGCNEWSFGDGATSTDTNPTHDYTAAGTYVVTLTAVDDDGFATATSHQTVTITG
jgi:hypothetical protein